MKQTFRDQEALLEHCADQISLSLIGILDVSRSPSKTLGTATFTKINEHIGLLTCGHVAGKILKLKEAGLLLFGRYGKHAQFCRVKTADLRISSFGKNNSTPDGPDIAFIELPHEITAGLQAKLSVIDLGNEFYRHTNLTPATGKRLNLLAGLLEIADKDSPGRTSGHTEIFTHQAKIFPTSVVASSFMVQNEFDYFRLSFPSLAETDIPSSFGGTSGGPLWSFVIERDSIGEMVVIDRQLIGLAFYQSNTSATEIVCHGPASFHLKLAPTVVKEFARQFPSSGNTGKG